MKRIALFAAITAIFGLSYTQHSLYTAHYYLFFGLSKSEFGFLSGDWLALGVDPFPIFSFIVKITYKYLSEYLFYIYPLLLAGVYALSFIGIAFEIFPKIRESKNLRFIFFAIFILIHSKLFYNLTFKMGWVFTQGVANYYLLGPAFQPSMFGVFLLLSIFLFLKGKLKTATLIAAITTVIHPTYLLSAGCLTFAYIIENYIRTKNFKEPIILGFIGLGVAIPVVIVTKFVLLKSTSPEIMAQAEDILVNFRIPHHTVPSRWIMNTLYRIPYVLGAIFLIRKTKLFIPMIVLFVVTILLSALQMATDNTSLALISPWRMSVLLVPISTVMLVAFIVNKMEAFCIPRSAFSIIVIVACSIYGTYFMITQKPYSDEFAELRSFIIETTQESDTYLIPPRSKNFQHFRLSTGAPAYVHFKLHPFKDTDIIKWREMINKAEAFYESDNVCNMISEFPVTRIITNESEIECIGVTKIFNNDIYNVYAL
ncbi:hypothetical protein HOF56_00710 [Candidatus Peribacteria bacterium]|jgi:hypothetical protein|nr:hypothetical protein [Candidatus Peribacteria bacterium]MBT4021192.1 hypothetical protein [Candidatus Peribacteria bacterium]MBT4240968.1 hypothetical protein [Candidatus Peribacteria bacterium]MBT4474612.1 hypothetical protein [Candidatus Peribacteria bacterium]